MSIVIKAVFYHRVSQIPHIEQIVSGMKPGTTLLVITSKKASVKLKNSLLEKNGQIRYEGESDKMCADGMHIRYRDVNIGIMTPSDESELTRDIRKEFRKILLDDDYDSAVLEIDMTFAQPRESVAVCKLSAALNIHMYTGHDSSRCTIASFPRLVTMDEQEIAVMDCEFQSPEFTVIDATDDLEKNGLRSSSSTAQRVVNRLVDKGFIVELRDDDYPGPRSNHGGNREKYYRSVEDGWMMYRINKRRVEKMGTSKHNAFSNSNRDQKSD